ncbi:hypothetical protein KW787_00920 [Candidatus Pacearchaeota archaeon]|nr:hypothetical protein [Candidatus Pacearchaeota archaeon]
MGRKYTKWENGKEVMYEETPGIFSEDRRIGELEERSSLFFYYAPGKYVDDPETKEEIHVSHSDADDHRRTSIGGQGGSLDTPNFGDSHAFTANRVFIPDKKPEPKARESESDSDSNYYINDDSSSSSNNTNTYVPPVPKKKEIKPKPKVEPIKEKLDPYIERLNRMTPSQLEYAASSEEKDSKLRDYAVRREIINKENNIFRLAILKGMEDLKWSYESGRRLEQIFAERPHLSIIKKRVYSMEFGRLDHHARYDPDGKKLIEEEERNQREYNAQMEKIRKEDEQIEREKGLMGFLRMLFS